MNNIDIVMREDALRPQIALTLGAHEILGAANWATTVHHNTNHFYGGDAKIPYWKHLQMAYDFGNKYDDLISNRGKRIFIFQAIWLHDVIEDCRVTYSKIKETFGVEVAELVYLCTNEKGRYRRDRENFRFFGELRSDRDALFVKLCDRLANIKHSVDSGTGIADMYRKEHEHFVRNTYYERYKPMYTEMNELLFPTVIP